MDPLVQRLARSLSRYPREQVLDAVLLILARSGLDDPAALSHELRARLGVLARDPCHRGPPNVPPEILQSVRRAFEQERLEAHERGRRVIGAAPARLSPAAAAPAFGRAGAQARRLGPRTE